MESSTAAQRAGMVTGGGVRPSRLLLIGCGAFARQAHLPAIAASNGDAELVAVIDRRDREEDVRNACALAGCAAEPAFLPRRALAEGLPDIDAVVISSPEATHGDYLEWALEGGLPTLVDKPLTVRRLVGNRLSDAGELVREWKACCRDAPRGVPFMLAAQRRYQTIYRRIAALVHDEYLRHGYAPTFVQCLTNDGLWHAARDYAVQPTYRNGAGKLAHTGYHVLDIVPWLLRHAQDDERPGSAISRVRSATVFASGFRPADAAAAWSPNHDGAAIRTSFPETLGEVNAALLVTLYDAQERTVCIIQIGTLHEGLSLSAGASLPDAAQRRTQAEAGRNKQELLSLYLGPTSAIWMRRFAKLTGNDDSRFGGNRHLELVHARNRRVSGAPAMLRRRRLAYRADDDAPTLEFLRALRQPDVAVTSPVHDHGIPVRLLAAAYASMASGEAVHVGFDAGDWALPPVASLELPDDDADEPADPDDPDGPVADG